MQNESISITPFNYATTKKQHHKSHTVRRLLADENNDGTTAKAVNVAGLLITQGPSGPLIQLLLQVDLDTPDSDTWNSFFWHTPELGEISKLNSQCLFDPSDID